MAEKGRPRAFDRREALRRAMRVFWTCGYEGASVNDLAEAMGINKPSLYAAFHCKENLFHEAVALYGEEEGAPIAAAMAEAPTARGAVEALLRLNVQVFADPQKPPGCMVVVSSLASAPENDAVRAFLSENRKAREQELRLRIERGIVEGDVPAGADVWRVAAFYTTVLNGLSVQARDGASLEALEAVVDSAMAAWDRIAVGV